MLVKTEIKPQKLSLYTFAQYEQICEIVNEGTFFEYDEGQIYWRHTQEKMPIDLVDFILSPAYSWENFLQLIESYHLMPRSKNHQVISRNLSMEIIKQLLKDDEFAYNSESNDLAIPNKDKSRNPDGVITPKEEIFNSKNQLTNPIVLFEILSPATQTVDKTQKLEEYRSIDSLQEYIMFFQDEPKAEQYIKQTKDRWQNNQIEGMDKSVEMPSVNIKLAMEKVYERIVFEKK